MIDISIILTHSISYGLGLATTYVIIKFKNLMFGLDLIDQRLDDIEKHILTPEEMAKQILTTKLPIKNLPPELAEQLRMEAEKFNKKVEVPSYMG